MDNMQPGQVFSPRGDLPDPVPPVRPEGAPAPVRPAELPQAAPMPAPEPETTIPYVPESPTAPSATPAWQPQHEAYTPPDQAGLNSDELHWTGAEFIAHDKTSGWYAILFVAGLVGAAVIYLLTKDKITAGIIALALVAFALFAARKPREQQYLLNRDGLQIGGRFYGFHDFKSFSIADEGGVASVVFMPMKRFMPPLTIYVPQENETTVTDFISQILPFEQHKADAVDALLHRIRF